MFPRKRQYPFEDVYRQLTHDELVDATWQRPHGPSQTSWTDFNPYMYRDVPQFQSVNWFPPNIGDDASFQPFSRVHVTGPWQAGQLLPPNEPLIHDSDSAPSVNEGDICFGSVCPQTLQSTSTECNTLTYHVADTKPESAAENSASRSSRRFIRTIPVLRHSQVWRILRPRLSWIKVRYPKQKVMSRHSGSPTESGFASAGVCLTRSVVAGSAGVVRRERRGCRGLRYEHLWASTASNRSGESLVFC